MMKVNISDDFDNATANLIFYLKQGVKSIFSIKKARYQRAF